MENKQRNRILSVLFIGVLMGALDIAIVGPALPAIRAQYAVSERALSWMFSIYVLFNLVGTPLMAKLSDLYGRRAIYILDVSLFAIGSLIIALSPAFWVVILGRAIQGFGAGGIFPVASAVIGDTFPVEKRGSALGLIGAVFGIAFIIGPILGGVILGLASWKWLFLINLPIALLVIVLSVRLLPATRPAHVEKFDLPGMLVLAGLLASLAYGINQIDTANFGASLVSLRVLPFLLAFLVLLMVFIQIEKRAKSPIIPLGMFNRRQISLTNAISSGAGVVEASLVFLPLLAVAGLGVRESAASFMLMPLVLAMAVGSPTAGRFLDKYGSKAVLIVGTSVSALGTLLLSFFAANLVVFYIATALIGLGLSALLGAPIRYIMLNEAKASERSVAQGLSNVFISVGQLLGSAVVGAMAASAVNPVIGYSNGYRFIGVVGIILVIMTGFLKNRAAEQQTVQQNQAAAAVN
ncbi:MAG: MFS transporter [Chloroflexi bacterium HGW-Chloroflexi-10]|nr:MAG: MFS transporter [Chloroflexi bacterium HGW-Chloroflexi-10]